MANQRAARVTRSGLRRALAGAAAAVAALVAETAQAQLPIAAATQFDVTGFIEEAVLDPACTADPHCGGTLKVNGHVVTIPRETIVILPANALTWQELFSGAPAPYGLTTAAGVPGTGLARADLPAPLTTYEARVVGNRVIGATDQYVAGLVYVSQQALNTGAGFVNFIDYATGELRVGGALGSATTGARVRLNDPSGRFGRAGSPDPRFTVDSDNPTIRSATGFPMCVPRVAPASAAPDALCPQGNRPVNPAGLFLATVQMNDPTNPAVTGVPPDATRQAPFEVGDYVTFSGTLVADGATPTAGPWPAAGTAATYVSAHTITNNVAIYTWPGTNPSYLSIDVALIGTGGLSVLGATEAAARTRFEGMTTDPSRNVHLYGLDLTPATGVVSDRDWGTIGVDPGPPSGAVKGRWRFRPPCTVAVATDRSCTPPPAGTFLPPTREVRAVIEGAWVPGQTTAYANGIVAGQYHAPILDYIFPENVPGSPIIANNFGTIPFLAQGGYTSAAGTLAGVLNPWPDATPPSPSCTPPVAAPGGPYSVASGGTVTLAANATGSAPMTFAWTAPAQGSLSSLTVAQPVYTAPAVAGQATVALSLTASNACGSSTAGTTVVVNAAAAPTVNPIAPLTVLSGAPVTLTATGSDPNALAITFAWQQTAGTTVLVPNPKAGATQSFAAPTLPVGQVTPVVLAFSVTATNAAGVTSAPVTTSVTVNPLPDAVAITFAEYRTTKQRLIVNATSSVVSPNVVLKLQPYVTATGTTFDPTLLGSTFTNNGGGLYTLTLVGAPEPAVPPAAPLVVQSNLGGASLPHQLSSIRQ